MKKNQEKPNIPLLEKLQCYLFPGDLNDCKLSYQNLYNRMYCFWRDTMQDTFKSIGLIDKANALSSDEFICHREFVGLYDQETPVGLLLFHWADLNYEVCRDLTEFRHYPRAILSKLKKEGHHCLMTISSLCVANQWRRTQIGPGVAEIVTGFKIHRFLESSASAILFVTRNNRNTHSLGYEHGGVQLKTNHMVYGLPADIIATYRDTARDSCVPGIKEMTDILWTNKIVAIDRRNN